MEPRNPDSKVNVKVYLVVRHDRLARPGEPNVKILGAYLNRASAQEVVDALPSTSIQRLVATKRVCNGVQIHKCGHHS